MKQKMSGRLALCMAVLALLFMVSCRQKTRPQKQANHQDADSTAIALVELNQRYVTAAVNQMALYVNAGDEPYVMDDMGYWYYVREKSQGLPAAGQPVLQLHQQVYLLDKDSTLCEDAILEVRPGKKETLEAIEMCLSHLRVGDKVSILAPWYFAYGQKGNGDRILPYTSLRIELAVLE